MSPQSDLVRLPAAPPASPYDWLRRHAHEHPGALAFGRWRDGRVEDLRTYAALFDEVRRASSGLSAEGVRQGDRVLISLPNQAEFAVVLLACLGLGATAVPCPVPAVGRVDAYRERLLGIARDCHPALMITSAAWASQAADLMGQPGAGIKVAMVEDLLLHDSEEPSRETSERVMLLQYTSGSTRRPRGVTVTRENIYASCRQAAVLYGESPADTAVTWVPLYHDMGLVTAVLRPLFGGYPSVLLTPQDFVRRPAVWLEAIDACGGTLASAPNFAYDYCVRKIPATAVAQLDLRSWRVARNASEVVRPETVQEFTGHFAAAGLRPDAMSPSYGLAEATLAVTAAAPGTEAVRLTLSRKALQSGRVVPTTGGPSASGETCHVISSGAPVEGTNVRILPGTVGADIGEIHVSGPQVSPGYWPTQAGASPGGKERWLRTGDLGFLRDGQLFVLGRKDDTLVIRGRNFHMADITAICDQLPGVRRGRVAAFVVGNRPDTVGLVLEVATDFQESGPACEQLVTTLTEALVKRLEFAIGLVGLVRPGLLPVTTSGKVRPSEVRRRVDEGEISFLFQRGAL